MKYKNAIYFSVILSLCPTVVFGAWYDPATWFQKPQAQNVSPAFQAPLSSPSTVVSSQDVKTSTSTATSSSLKPVLENKKPTGSTKKLPQILTNSQLIKKIKPAVIYISTSDSSGSGFIISSDGFGLTNAHVVAGVDKIKITTFDKKVYDGTVVGRDEVLDIAVIKIVSKKTFSKVTLGDSEKIEQGEEVFTLGFPFGIKGDVSFKEGTLSRRVEAEDGVFFEISAEIHPGNSGGPLVDRYGNVVGINTAVFGKQIYGLQIGETIKLAIPINVAKEKVASLKSGKNVFLKVSPVEKQAPEQSVNCNYIKKELADFEDYNNNIEQNVQRLRVGVLENSVSKDLKGAAYFQALFDYYLNKRYAFNQELEQTKKTINSISLSYSDPSFFSNYKLQFADVLVDIKSCYDTYFESYKFLSSPSVYSDTYSINMAKDGLTKAYEFCVSSATKTGIADTTFKSIQKKYKSLLSTNNCSASLPDRQYTLYSCPSESTYNHSTGSCVCVNTWGGEMIFDAIEGTCKIPAKYCSDTLGVYGHYNSSKIKCECDPGYIIGADGKCKYQY